MVIALVLCLSTLLTLLAWIGWRFFVMPSRNVNMAMFGASTLGICAADTRNAPPKVAGLEREQWKVRFNWGWIKWFSHWSLWLAPLLVGLTVMGVLALSGRISLAPLEALDFNRQEHIQSALNPEKLVPPPLLPPSMFINTERPGLETADRDWNRLDQGFMQLVLQVFARMETRGYPMVLLEGYRSPERQDMLANLGGHVTNARAFQSKHQYGLALDAAPLKNGKLVISERDPWAMQAYQALGEEAEKAGLIWGGRWKLQDYGHIETAGSIAAQLKKK